MSQTFTEPTTARATGEQQPSDEENSTLHSFASSTYYPNVEESGAINTALERRRAGVAEMSSSNRTLRTL